MPGLLAKKAKNIARLLSEAQIYWDQFGAPIPLRIVSAKFGRVFENAGGFHEVMQELENDGSLVLERHRSGKTLVYPSQVAAVLQSNIRRIG